MCDNHSNGKRRQHGSSLSRGRKQLPHGSSLSHGKAHSNDHTRSRRSFLATMGLATVGGSFMLAGRPVHALGHTPLTGRLRAGATDRILVLIQLEGGNDGLNTVVPIRNDIYYSARPNLAIQANQTLAIDADHGWHPSLSTFRDLYDEGKMAVVQNVGYDNSNLSHFRSTDIFMSATDENVVLDTGWVGRYLDETNPGFQNQQPDEPLAVQVGGSGLIFKAPDIDMGMSVRDLNRFDDFLDSGRFYSLDGLPNTNYGTEMGFLRTTVNAAFRYGASIQDAAARSVTTATYPDGPLGQGMAAIARLINGQLTTNIYVVTLGGFDTHALQVDDHSALLTNLSQSVNAFLSDIVDPAIRDKIVLATFSEFGRRIEQNGSEGTDHGTSAPMFVFGNRVNGGLYGTEADLSNPDQFGNMRHDIDYRQVYATLLEEWLGTTPEISSSVLARAFQTLPLISNSTVGTERDSAAATFGLSANYPNPFTDQTTIRYRMDRAGSVRIELFDIRGRRIQLITDQQQNAGDHEVVLDGSGLAAGSYIARMQSGERTSTATLIRVH